MADVRSMLRSELAARGNQSSNRSTSKKRKVSTDDTPAENRRPTKLRNVSSDHRAPPPETKHSKRLSQHVASPPDLATVPEEEAPAEPTRSVEDEGTAGEKVYEAPTGGIVDEDEWTAFERDVATPEAAAAAPTALNAPASIQAQPMTAEQLAAQAREQQSSQHGKRDVEAEEEKEEAQWQLEEELEEMEGLEERVRKLRERREMVRRGGTLNSKTGGAEGPAGVQADAEKGQTREEKENEKKKEDEDEDEGSEDEDENEGSEDEDEDEGSEDDIDEWRTWGR